ncbi:MAG: tetratricopeptide repeat protein [Rhodobacteraceae bacterium]|nr:tetratricopeptide repeat protein [Paracoccaceae bacterium]
MNTAARNQIRSISTLARVARNALAATCLASTLHLGLAANAHADTAPLDTPHLGTPLDLPITLAGSYLAARLADMEKDFAQSAAFYQEALSTDPDNNMLLDRAFMLSLANGEIFVALNYAEELKSLNAETFVGPLTRAANEITLENYSEAAEILAPVNVGPLAQLTVDISRAWALYGTGQVDEALNTIEELDGPEWFDVFKSTHKAYIAFAAGRTKQALKEIEKAYNQDNGALRVIDTYARILAANDKTDVALSVLNDYEQLIPGHPLIAATRAEVEAGTAGHPYVTTPQQGVSEILYGLGAAIGREGAQELSTVYLQLALYLNPRAEFAALALAGQFELMDQTQRSIDTLSMIPDDSPLKRDAEIQIGMNYDAIDDLEQAREHLENLIKQDPDDLEAIVSLGNILRSREIYDEAYDIYSMAIDKVSEPSAEHWTMFYFRGICLERLDRWSEAEADLRKALELQEDQPLVLNYLGYSLVDQGFKLPEALEMIERAVELRPRDGYIVDSLGWAYYRLGRYEEAVVELERAIELRSSDPVINDHLGDAYWKVGRRIEARFQWNHARDLEPAEKDLPIILEKIKNGMPTEDAGKVSIEQSDG